MKTASPLRYPGGKWRLFHFFSRVIAINNLKNCVYIEPYAGGGSLALSLLRNELVARIQLNDLSPALYWVWWVMMNRGEELVHFVRNVPLTLDMWQEQKSNYSRGPGRDPFLFGCAVFYLNRTNHSGILNGGVIGGKQQSGQWQIGARFNRIDLENRIRYISTNRHRISLDNRDAVEFLRDLEVDQPALIYLDPPYVSAGKALYLNSYSEDDHRQIQQFITHSEFNWIVSYDDVPLIRRIYRGFRCREVALLHTARKTHLGREILYFSPGLKIPRHQLSSPTIP